MIDAGRSRQRICGSSIDQLAAVSATVLPGGFASLCAVWRIDAGLLPVFEPRPELPLCVRHVLEPGLNDLREWVDGGNAESRIAPCKTSSKPKVLQPRIMSARWIPPRHVAAAHCESRVRG
jgi:hypothetical protein